MNDPEMLVKNYRYLGAGEDSREATQVHKILCARAGVIVTTTLFFDQQSDTGYSWMGLFHEFLQQFETV